MSVICYIPVICLVIGGVVRVRLYVSICYLMRAQAAVRRGSGALSTSDDPGA
jgi:hypothetical protein